MELAFAVARRVEQRGQFSAVAAGDSIMEIRTSGIVWKGLEGQNRLPGIIYFLYVPFKTCKFGKLLKIHKWQ